MLKSPSIQIFEKASTSPATPATGVGMATVGFSTMGPLNKLMRFNSYSQFERIMGKPVADYPFAHLMASKVLNSGNGDVYFIRAGESTAKKATVYVANHEEMHPVRAFYACAISEDNLSTYDRIIEPYFVGHGIGDIEAVNSVTATIQIPILSSSGTLATISKEFTFNKKTLTLAEGETTVDRFAVHVDTIVNRFNADPAFLQHAKLYNKLNGVNGLFIVGNSYETGAGITVVIDSGTVEAERISDEDLDFEGLLNITPSGTSVGTSTFTIEAKYPGSGYNGYFVKKYDYDNPLTDSSSTFILEVYSKENILLETFTELTLDTFISKINDETSGSEFIYIDDSATVTEFVDGTYVLGFGELLPDGNYGFDDEVGSEVVSGTDGVPSVVDGDELVTSMFINALMEPSLLNLDNVFFSIISVPDSQNSLVQDAAVSVAMTRGDAVCVLDVPFDYSIDKTTIDSAVSWHNGGSGLRSSAIESSYAVIYYGWTSVANPYGTGNLMVPPSVQMVPLMLSIDSMDGSYYAPAGATRGRIIASDYVYSPDQEDREKMAGGVNCINPIIYSNARGLMAYGQRTADRTSSPLNRINIRRMVNEIKRLIYSRLDVVRFELNNATTQDRARRIVSDIFFSYKSAGAITSYTVNVSSPGGSERDVLNVYVDFIPVGLVERIRVYLNISESGVTIAEEA